MGWGAVVDRLLCGYYINLVHAPHLKAPGSFPHQMVTVQEHLLGSMREMGQASTPLLTESSTQEAGKMTRYCEHLLLCQWRNNPVGEVILSVSFLVQDALLKLVQHLTAVMALYRRPRMRISGSWAMQRDPCVNQTL